MTLSVKQYILVLALHRHSVVNECHRFIHHERPFVWWLFISLVHLLCSLGNAVDIQESRPYFDARRYILAKVYASTLLVQLNRK